MERITGKEVQTMMEALHQVYVQPEEQVENLQEEVSDIEEQRLSGPQRRARQQAASADAAAVKAAELKAGGGQAAVQSQLKQRYGGRMPSQRQLARHSSGASATRSVAATGRENLYRGGGGDAAMAKGLTRQQVMAQGVKNMAAKPTAAAPTKPVTPTKPVASDTKPTTPAGATAADTKPAVPTGTTASGQKFERRLPTMAELRAAQAARAAAKASGGDRAAQEKAAVAGGVQQAQRQASVDAAVKRANSPEVQNRPAPAGSALARQQQAQGRTVSGSGAMGSAANPQVRAQLGLKPINPAPAAAKPGAAPVAAKPAQTRAQELAAIQAKAKADTLKKSRLGEGLQSEGIVDAIKKVATKVLEPADNSPAAQAARMGARRPQTDTEKKVGKKTAEVLSREEFDNFDLIKAYLVDEGVTEEEALTIMTVMEDDQREEILEVLDYLKKKAGAISMGRK
jgi:hypothetical protein